MRATSNFTSPPCSRKARSTPTSEESVKRMAREGLMQVFVEAGAMLLPASCGPCNDAVIGPVHSGEVSISTAANNNHGRFGAKDAELYLGSPATVAASAVTGVITGRNFGMGPKMNGYIALQALGLGLVCESMPFLAYRAAVGCGLRVMTDCVNATDICATGDELEVDFRNGFFINHTRDIRREYPPVPDALQELIELGGNAGWLKQWQGNHGKPSVT